MKKYLVRSPFDPLTMCTEDPKRWVWNNYAGGNSGNLMYAYGVMNVLKTEKSKLDFFYKSRWSDEEVEKVNSAYDAVILPMADAFRKDFQRTLDNYTDFIKKLSIPVIVIGIGLRADYEPNLKNGFPFDDSVKAFVSAVLDKSALLGLRGQITADYLKGLGFREGIHYSVIGCPSLYTYGEGIYTRPVPQKLKRLAMNTNDYYNIGHINEFFNRTFDKFKDICLVQQIQAEFVDLYVGKCFPFTKKMKGIPPSLLKERYGELKKSDRIRYFFDVISWINFLRNFDLFIGNRFHGSVAAVLAGTPNIMFPFNARTREMTEFHCLTSIKPDKVIEGTSIIDYIDKVDFQSFDRKKEANLTNYMEFLQKMDWKKIYLK